MIYFVEAPKLGLVKIGFSDDVRKRMFNLRSNNHEHLILLGVMEGSREMERKVQSMFQKSHGEWYYPSPELFRFISLNCDEELRPSQHRDEPWSYDP